MNLFGDFSLFSSIFRDNSLTESYPGDSGILFGESGLVCSVPDENVTMAEPALVTAEIVPADQTVEATNCTLWMQAKIHIADKHVGTDSGESCVSHAQLVPEALVVHRVLPQTRQHRCCP